MKKVCMSLLIPTNFFAPWLMRLAKATSYSCVNRMISVPSLCALVSLCHCFHHDLSENKLKLEKFFAWTWIRPLLPLQPVPNNHILIKGWSASITGMWAHCTHGFRQACVINLQVGSVFKSSAKQEWGKPLPHCWVTYLWRLCYSAPELTLTGGSLLDGV